MGGMGGTGGTGRWENGRDRRNWRDRKMGGIVLDGLQFEVNVSLFTISTMKMAVEKSTL